MAKLNKIIVDSIEYDVGEVQRVNEIPTTVSNDSLEIIIYNNRPYIKTIAEDGSMSYEIIQGDVEAFFPFFDSQTLVLSSESTLNEDLTEMVQNVLEAEY